MPANAGNGGGMTCEGGGGKHGGGDYVVERRGFEDPARGIKSLCNIGQKRNEKKRKEKKISLLACPGMRQWRERDLRGLRGEAWWRGGGLRTRRVGKRVSVTLVRKGTKKERKEK